MADTPALSQASTSLIPVRSISLAILVAVVLYVGMAILPNWEAFGASVLALPGLLWVKVVTLSLLSYLLRFARWHHFITSLGNKVPILRNLEIYLAAFALTLTPGKAGETVRSVYLHPYGVSYPHSIGSFVSERLMDLVAVATLAILAVSMFQVQRLWIFAVIACIFIVILLFRSRLLSLIVGGAVGSSVVSHLANLVATIRFLLSGWRVAVAVPLSLVAWMAQGISLYFIVHALDYKLTVSTVMSVYCMSIITGAASFIPGGLVATEAAIVIFLTAAGVNYVDAITASLISRGLTLWLAIIIGVLAMLKLAINNSLENKV